MNPLPLPAKLPIWAVAGFKVDRPTLRSRLGPPHHVETDYRRTYGGEADAWGLVSDSGQRIVVVLRVPYELAVIYSDPPDAHAAMTALQSIIQDSKTMIAQVPEEMT